MDDTLTDIPQCEEQLKTTLQCDDKEKLRRKLLYLQREYHRTAQRLQRAERSEAVQRHVRSRITQQQHTHKDQGGQEDRASPTHEPSLLIPTKTNASDAAHQCKRHTGDCENPRSQVVRFLLPSEAACPQTLSSIHESAPGRRPSPSLRLRSRRSRLRWEKQSSVVGVSTDSSQDGPEQHERMEPAATQTTKGDKIQATEDVNDSEELISGGDSESPSLLLCYVSSFGQNDARDVEQAIQEGPEQWDQEVQSSLDTQKESQPLLECESVIETQETEQEGTQSEREKVGLEQSEDGQMDISLHGGNNNVDDIVEDGRESEKSEGKNPVKEDQNNMEAGGRDKKGDGLLDSCTLVEGLLFPAEYYVRTTRRMTSSHSQPDIQAVILSQLNVGRHRRSRGNGRRLSHNGGSNKQTCDSVEPWSGSQEAAEANSQSSTAGSAPRRARGRKRRRGGGRPETPHRSDTRPPGHEHNSDNPQLPTSPVSLSPLLFGTTASPSPSLCAADEAKSPGPEQLLITPSRAAEHECGGSGPKDSPAGGHQLYPIFLKNSRSGSQTSGGSLTVASPPAPPSLPLPPLSLSLFVKNLIKFDVPQDFHLPDEHFASLKLHKLQKVAEETGVETFLSPSYCTRRSVRRYALSGSDAVTPLSVSLGSTAQASPSPGTTEVTLASAPPVEDQELSGPRAGSRGHTASAESATADGGCEDPGEEEAELRDFQEFTNPTDDREAPSFSFQSQRSVEEPSDSSLAPRFRDDADADAGSAAEETNKCSEPDLRPGVDAPDQKPPLHHSVGSQLLLSPLASTLLATAQLPSSGPPLPSLGVTPQSVLAALPLTPSPAAPALALPPPHSPSTQALSPPPLSPCPSLPPHQPPPWASGRPAHAVVPANEPHVSAIESEGNAAEEDLESCTYTLKSPSGGCLVDVCCLLGSSGLLCVAAAGKWAVCLWTQTSASDWSLTHTWSFDEMVISVFPVPDAAGLVCVTLGQLEIREVRILSCSSLAQASLCDGLVQTVVGVSQSRVVTSSLSASGSELLAFTLSDSGSASSSRPLASPGVCVGALSPVHGLPDALIGTDESEQLFIWNLKTGQLLQTVHLGDGFSHAACLRGYSHSVSVVEALGVLFVLLQHQFLSSHEEAGGDVPVMETGAGKLSLVAVNPISGKSIVATSLYPPSSWSGRLCEVDVSDCSVVGLSQSGCVCVWELGCRGATRMVDAPEKEGWQLARWGGGGTLLTGHHNGDVTLHYCRQSLWH